MFAASIAAIHHRDQLGCKREYDLMPNSPSSVVYQYKFM
uniref:Uncharacterized protein n=1 Tax=Sphingobacterium sp. (strain 21) TaxID=743722 RepID=F4C9M2_SPHS2